MEEKRETGKSAIFIHNVTNNGKGKLLTKLDDFSFIIVNFPFICGNIPLAPAYGMFISKLIRYAKACRNYSDVLNRTGLLTIGLL